MLAHAVLLEANVLDILVDFQLFTKLSHFILVQIFLTKVNRLNLVENACEFRYEGNSTCQIAILQIKFESTVIVQLFNEEVSFTVCFRLLRKRGFVD